jgi:hypothetical protein
VTPEQPRPKARRPYQVSGYYGHKRALSRGGLALVDGRSGVGRQLARGRADLVAHLGGSPSTTQARVIEAVLTLDVLIDTAVSALQTIGPVDKRKHCYRPIARELAAMIEKRHGLLRDLGFQPAQKRVPSLQEYLAAKAPPAHAERAPAPEAPHPRAATIVDPGASCEAVPVCAHDGDGGGAGA